MYFIKLRKQALKDVKKVELSEYKNKVAELLKVIRNNPFQNPPPYKKLQGKVNTYSRRINTHTNSKIQTK